MSDTHSMWAEIKYPEADVLVMAGDILGNYSRKPTLDGIRQIDELWELNRFLGTLKTKYKEIVLVAGNHDWVFELYPNEVHQYITNFIYLKDSSVEINGIKFYGSPYQKYFHGWAFNMPNHWDNYDRYRMFAKDLWAQIPEDTNVLITHGPPQDILDECIDGRKVGCEYLARRTAELPQLRAHIFGHIHHSAGLKQINSTKFINAAICTEAYRPTNPPIVIEV